MDWYGDVLIDINDDDGSKFESDCHCMSVLQMQFVVCQEANKNNNKKGDFKLLKINEGGFRSSYFCNLFN